MKITDEEAITAVNTLKQYCIERQIPNDWISCPVTKSYKYGIHAYVQF